jgi:hypothetical protein
MNLSDLADTVLREVDAQKLEKNASTPVVVKQSEMALMLTKLATELRRVSKNNNITYADLADFRERYGR